MAKRILFSGYAPVHFVCFLPVYLELQRDPDVELYLSGGFRVKDEKGEVSYSLAGFYDPYPVDRSRVLGMEEVRGQDFDVLVCAHTSDALFPRKAEKTVQIFHGVSFKNLAVREKALAYDLLCLPGLYHAELYRKHGLLSDTGTQCLLTGFPKADGLVDQSFDRAAYFRRLGLDPERPTLLLAPTGDRHNALELMGRELIEAIDSSGQYNLLIKPHDHPKKALDWLAELGKYENTRVRLVRDKDITASLRAADLLISDASSVAVEYTLLDRPIVFVDVPQLLETVRGRAPAMDLETYGRRIGSIIKHPEEILGAVADGLAHPQREGALRRRMAEHIFHRAGGAVSRVAGVVRYAAGLATELPGDIEVLHRQSA